MRKLSRRELLGWAATGAAGLLVPSIVRRTTVVFGAGRREPARTYSLYLGRNSFGEYGYLGDVEEGSVIDFGGGMLYRVTGGCNEAPHRAALGRVIELPELPISIIRT